MTWLTRWWLAPAPAQRLAGVRILVGLYATVYLFTRFGEFLSVARHAPQQFAPAGVAKLLAGPVAPALVQVAAIVALILCAMFTLGIAFRITAPLAAIALLCVTSYRNSWGMVFHTENLLVLHVIALACTPAADAWAVWPRRDRDAAPHPHGYGWGLKLVAALTAVAYVLAGIAKLRIAGFHWMDGELLRNQVAIDNLRKALLGDAVAPFATQLLDHPNGFIGFAIMTLVIELGAPILILGTATDNRWLRRLAKLWVLGAFGFHLGVVLMMNIWFTYPLSVIPFTSVFAVEGMGRIRNLLPAKLRL